MSAQSESTQGESAQRVSTQTRRRVVITGCGVVSSIGTGVREFGAALRAGRSNVRPITVFDTTGFAHNNGCEVPDFEPERWIHNVDVDEMGRASRFSAAAARLAV